VKPQTTVQIFDPLCEVQSDKASVEITSPYNGVVRELLVKEGEVAKVGAGLCMIEVEQEGSESPVESVGELVESSSTTSAASGTSQPISSPPLRAEEPVQETAAERRPHPMDPSHASSLDSRATSHVLAKPSVRHFARSKGVDLTLLAPGSGSGGKIEKGDVEAYLSRSSEIRAPSEGDVIVELGRTRYSMWKAMTKVRMISSVAKVHNRSCAFTRVWRSRILGIRQLSI
jgi:2-oxoisovalerate dehydrogenase E2 component (dihydrolipoyl transacylase)